MPDIGRSSSYGSLDWFEREYGKVDEDPWGLARRTSQLLRYQRVLATLDALPESPTHVMDVGCATGDFTHLLSMHFKRLQTTLGVDFVDSALERARDKFPDLSFAKESIFTIGDNYPSQFDLITCLEVIYYIERDQQVKALRSLRRTLRPGGYAVFSSFISPPPHFYPDEFLHLVGREFEIIRSEIMYLRLVSLLEKVGGRFGRLISTLRHRVNKDCGNKYCRLPLSAVLATERWSRSLASLTASHTIVLARSRT